jgi:hypothetical protein
MYLDCSHAECGFPDKLGRGVISGGGILLTDSGGGGTLGTLAFALVLAR